MQDHLERQLADLNPGDHACPIHDGPAEQLAVAVPFIRNGLLNGERCLYAADRDSSARLIRSLRFAGVDVAAEQRRGALLILDHGASFLRGGAFDPAAMIHFLAEAETSSLALGYSGMRFLGDMSWSLDPGTDPDLIAEYESLLNEFLVDSCSKVFCQYPRSQSDPALYGILCAHPMAILGEMVCPNPYYEPPGRPLRRDAGMESEFAGKRAEWWKTKLREAKATGAEREEAREGLQEKEETIRLLLDSTAEAIYGMDLEGRCTIYNPACLKLLGYSETDVLIGKNFHELIHYQKADGEPYPRKDCPVNHVIRSGVGVHVMDETFWRADGTSFPADYFCHPMRRNGKTVGAVVTFLDISARKKMEAQLLQSQKMEAIGQLAGGVAHDFNNLLIIITGYSELLLHSLAPNHPSRKPLEEIRRAGERSASLTRQLLAFSRKQLIAPKVFNLNNAVRDTENLLSRVIGEDITLAMILHPDLEHVRADPGQMEQILLNLAVNARDAMPLGGKLTIETANVELDGAFSLKQPDVNPGRYVMFSMTDSGAGMTEELRRRIFEPFFTTKPLGKGTGLGLAVVHGAVKQAGGCIEVFSEPDVGTTFKVYLPAVKTALDEESGAIGLIRAPRGTETVLLVEDEDAVRALLGNILRESGYTVLEASSAEEALRIGMQYREPIHLLATDVVMPGEGGRALAEKFSALRGEMKVLYLSGYTDDAVIRHGILQDNVDFLQKPFSPNALAHKVRDVLAKASLEHI